MCQCQVSVSVLSNGERVQCTPPEWIAFTKVLVFGLPASKPYTLVITLEYRYVRRIGSYDNHRPRRLWFDQHDVEGDGVGERALDDAAHEALEQPPAREREHQWLRVAMCVRGEVREGGMKYVCVRRGRL